MWPNPQGSHLLRTSWKTSFFVQWMTVIVITIIENSKSKLSVNQVYKRIPKQQTKTINENQLFIKYSNVHSILQRCVQNPVTYIQWFFFSEIVNNFKLLVLTMFAKLFRHRCLAEVQRQCAMIIEIPQNMYRLTY